MPDDLALSARHELRVATQAVHERLHHLPGFAALAAGTLDRDSYAALLGRIYGFHLPMEAQLADMLTPVPRGLDPAQWQRAHLLRQDLQTLGIDPARLPRWAGRQPHPSQEAALGSLYVLVGSTLGGRVLARQLDSVLPGGDSAGRSFLLRSLEPGHVSWAGLCRVLDEYGAGAASRSAMIDSAAWTFGQFESWFSNPPGRASAA